MTWKRILRLWHELAWWEKEIFLWFGNLIIGRRAILPAITLQAGGMAAIVWVAPQAPLIWLLAYIISPVYIFLVIAWLRKLKS